MIIADVEAKLCPSTASFTYKSGGWGHNISPDDVLPGERDSARWRPTHG